MKKLFKVIWQVNIKNTVWKYTLVGILTIFLFLIGAGCGRKPVINTKEADETDKMFGKKTEESSETFDKEAKETSEFDSGNFGYDLENTSDIVVSDEEAREINKNIEGWTESEILNLSEEMLISMGQLVLCDKLDNQAAYYPFGEKIGVENPYEMSIAQQSADGEASARQIAEAYYTPVNDSYWFNDFWYIGETDLFWMYLSYYNNNNVKDKPRYCLVFNKEYFDYENSILYGDLTEAGIKEFFSLYKVPNVGICIGSFVHEDDTRFEYVSYYISICYGDYGLNDSVMLVKYCWNIDKNTQVVQLVSDMESIMESEIPETMHEEPEIEFDDVD